MKVGDEKIEFLNEFIARSHGKISSRIGFHYVHHIPTLGGDLSLYKDEDIEQYHQDILNEVKDDLIIVKETLKRINTTIESHIKTHKVKPSNNGLKIKKFNYSMIKLPGNGKQKFWISVSVRKWDEESDVVYATGPLCGRIYIDKKKPVGERIWIQSIPIKMKEKHSAKTIANFETKLKELFTEKFFDSIPAASHEFKWVDTATVSYGVIVNNAVFDSDFRGGIKQCAKRLYHRQSIRQPRTPTDSEIPIKFYKTAIDTAKFKERKAFIVSSDLLMDPNAKPAVMIQLKSSAGYGGKRETYIITEDGAFSGDYHLNTYIVGKPEPYFDKDHKWAILKFTSSFRGTPLHKGPSEETIENNEFFGHFISKL